MTDDELLVIAMNAKKHGIVFNINHIRDLATALLAAREEIALLQETIGWLVHSAGGSVTIPHGLIARRPKITVETVSNDRDMSFTFRAALGDSRG